MSGERKDDDTQASFGEQSTPNTGRNHKEVHMNRIKERRKRKAICYRCQSPDYRIEKQEYEWMNPNIICNSCGNSWQYGGDGGKYKELE